MAFVQIVKVTGLTSERYDRVKQIAYGGQLADGELFHVAGGSGDDWYVVDGWVSRDLCDRSMQQLMPAFAEVEISMDPMAKPVEFDIHVFRTRDDRGA
jgi:hypothetical protein